MRLGVIVVIALLILAGVYAVADFQDTAVLAWAVLATGLAGWIR
jgi:hypothetical protein